MKALVCPTELHGGGYTCMHHWSLRRIYVSLYPVATLAEVRHLNVITSLCLTLGLTSLYTVFLPGNKIIAKIHLADSEVPYGLIFF